MANVLITGAGRGLGLALATQFASLPTSQIKTVIATSRSKEPSAGLSALIAEHSASKRVRYLSLDVTDAQSIAAAATAATTILQPDGLAILVNNAGISSPTPGPVAELSATDLATTLASNVTGPHLTTAALLPLLRTAPAPRKIVNITSTLGSIAMADVFAAGPFPGYKVSKTALNMLTAQWALGLKDEGGFVVFGVSPGWLRTDLGGQYADLPVEVGAQETARIVMEAREEDNGAFRNIRVEGHASYDGSNPPW